MAVPFGFVMVIGPVVEPAGTLVTISVLVAEVTLAAVPLNVTIFSLAVVLKPEPKIVTVAPTVPTVGVNPPIVTSGVACRVTEMMLPTGS